ncbi:MAG: sugar phosphate isomerase/epimerase [Candidatus Methanoplasma sp.]|nr:sugar phosphate isomerase/epimerase [Candidatus Methanoplasma sp.]
MNNIPGQGTPIERLDALGCDGLELFTLYDDVPAEYGAESLAVHLPYAVDWYGGWTGRLDASEFDAENVRPVMFGRDRSEAVSNIVLAIKKASALGPAYGVFHAGNSNIDEVMLHAHTDDDRDVLRALAEMMNLVAAELGGEMPFRIAFENLWWSGLKLKDERERRFLEDHLEFDNWGFCLDTGHMMNTLPDAYDEDAAIDGLLKIFDRYSRDMKDRVRTMHFHLSTSAEYRNTFEERPRPPGEGVTKTIEAVYPHIMNIDQHRPFSSVRCVEIAETISPDFLTHEMIGSGSGDAHKDLLQQTAFFRRRSSDAGST